MALKDNACSYARNLQQRVQTRGHLSMDVEDLVKYGKTNRSCPYFLARDAASMVDLVFAPYSYLIDPGTVIQKITPKTFSHSPGYGDQLGKQHSHH